MFKNILIPISSEFYQKDIFRTAAFLAEKFQSKIHLFYIIEEKTLNQTEKSLNSYRTGYDKEETKKEIIRRHIHVADTIIFEDAKQFFADKNIPFDADKIEGEFSEVIKSQINKKKFDLIYMAYEKGCLLNYRLFSEAIIPIWIESGYGNNSILAVCSNLAPNQKVPDISIKLSKILGWDLHMIYVIDIEDAVEVDINGKRSERKSENELLVRGQQFVNNMDKKGISASIVKGNLEKQTLKAAENIGTGLVIIGREQKKKQILGISTKSVKKKMAEKSRYSILFLN